MAERIRVHIDSGFSGQGFEQYDRATREAATGNARVGAGLRGTADALMRVQGAGQSAAGGLRSVGTSVSTVERQLRGAKRAAEDFLAALKLGVGIDLGGRLVSSIGRMPRVFTNILSEGIDYNAFVSQATRGIGAVIKMFKPDEIPDFDTAFEVSAQTLQKMRVLADGLSSDFTTLLEAYRDNAANAFGAGITDLEKQIDLVATLSESVKAVGLPSQQAAQEIRALLTNNLGPDATLAKAAGIKTQDIKDALEAGQLYEYLTDKFKDFRAAGALAAKEYDGALSNLKQVINEIKGELAKPTFEVITQAAIELREALMDGDLTDALADIGGGISSVVDDGVELIKWAIEYRGAIVAAASATGRLVALFAAWKIGQIIAGLGLKVAALGKDTQMTAANTGAQGANTAALSAGTGAATGNTAVRAANTAAVGAHTAAVHANTAAQVANARQAAIAQSRAAAPIMAVGGQAAVQRREAQRDAMVAAHRAGAAQPRGAITPMVATVGAASRGVVGALGAAGGVAAALMVGNQIGNAINDGMRASGADNRAADWIASIFVDIETTEIVAQANKRAHEAMANAKEIGTPEAMTEAYLEIAEAVDQVTAALGRASGAQAEMAKQSIQVNRMRQEQALDLREELRDAGEIRLFDETAKQLGTTNRELERIVGSAGAAGMKLLDMQAQLKKLDGFNRSETLTLFGRQDVEGLIKAAKEMAASASGEFREVMEGVVKAMEARKIQMDLVINTKEAERLIEGLEEKLQRMSVNNDITDLRVMTGEIEVEEGLRQKAEALREAFQAAMVGFETEMPITPVGDPQAAMAEAKAMAEASERAVQEANRKVWQAKEAIREHKTEMAKMPREDSAKPQDIESQAQRNVERARREREDDAEEARIEAEDREREKAAKEERDRRALIQAQEEGAVTEGTESPRKETKREASPDAVKTNATDDSKQISQKEKLISLEKDLQAAELETVRARSQSIINRRRVHERESRLESPVPEWDPNVTIAHMQAKQLTEQLTEQDKQRLQLAIDTLAVEQQAVEVMNEKSKAAQTEIKTAKEEAAAALKEISEAIEEAADARAMVSARRGEYVDELAILEARAAGEEELAKSLERQRSIKIEQMRIARDLQISDKEALSIAQRKIDLEEQISRASEVRAKTGRHTSELMAPMTAPRPFDDREANDPGRSNREWWAETYRRRAERSGLKMPEPQLAIPQAPSLLVAFPSLERDMGLPLPSTQRREAEEQRQQRANRPAAAPMPEMDILRRTPPDEHGRQLEALRREIMAFGDTIAAADKSNADGVQDVRDGLAEAMRKVERLEQQARAAR